MIDNMKSKTYVLRFSYYVFPTVINQKSKFYIVGRSETFCCHDGI
jgi:hypothetical protein